MNEASKWRLALAREVAPIITTNSRVQAIMLAGSASRGCADRYSDIEIGVFWDGPPSDEERMAHIEPAGGVFWELDPYDEAEKIWMEEWGLGGVKMDVRNLTVEEMERILSDVVEHYDTSEFKQSTISAVQHSIPLYNVALLERWKAKLAHYPDELGWAMVREHSTLYNWCWWVEMLVWREDWPLVYSSFSEAIFQALAMLMGLNRIYHPGFKWMNRLIGEMQIAPPDLAARIKAIFQVDPKVAIQEVGPNPSRQRRSVAASKEVWGTSAEHSSGMQGVRKLVLEVYDFVEKHMPEVDIQNARRVFLHQRPQFEQAPLGDWGR